MSNGYRSGNRGIRPRVAKMLNYDLFGSSGGKRAKRRAKGKLARDKHGRSHATRTLLGMKIF